MIREFVKKHRFLVIISLLFFALRLPSLFEPYWYGDEGIYLVLGKAIRSGWTLYSQIHDNKPPTLYYLAAISQTVFGFRFLLMLWMIPTIYVFFLISKKIFSLKLAKISTVIFLILTSIPLLEGNIANAEIFMLLPTLLGVYLLIRHDEPSVQDFLLSGLLLGFSFTIKVPVIFEFAFLGLWFFVRKFYKFIPRLLVFLIGFTIPISLWAIYFYFNHAISEFVFAALLQNFGYLSSWATGSHSGSATSSGLVGRGIILFVSWIIIYALMFRKKIGHQTAFILLWLSATMFSAFLSTRPYPHYLIFVLPPLCLGLLTFVGKSGLFEKSVTAIFLFGLLFSCFHYKFYVYPVFSYYSNFYNYALGRKTTSDYRQFFGSEMNDLYQLSSWLKTNTKSDEKIFIWSDQPDVYALADRLPVGRFTVAYHVVDFQQFDYIINQLEIHTPQTIVFYSNYPYQFPKLNQFLSLYYFPDNVIGQAIIFHRR